MQFDDKSGVICRFFLTKGFLFAILRNFQRVFMEKKFAYYTPQDGDEYMSDAQLAHFRQVLSAWRDELLEESLRTQRHIHDETGSMPDINDRASQEEEFALTLRTRDRERKLLRKIEKSLSEIEIGDYGYCQTCGTEIGLKRLSARPTATLCIDCKTLAEIKEKQVHG